MQSIISRIVVVLLLATSASAGTINIQFTDLDLTYDGSTLMTQMNPDELSTVAITDAGGVITKFTDDLDIELNIPDVAISAGTPVGWAASGSGGSLTLNVAGGSLVLGLESVVVKHTDLGSFDYVFGGTSANVIEQSLPLVTLVDPITFSFSQTVNAGTLTDDGTNLTGFTSFDTGEITSVPEPVATNLLCIAAVTMFGFRRRRSEFLKNT